ncbi:TerD family protein [Cereibacter sphaeroides]|uniref:TerD family protein n=1 Tax=Cereibacter sphaeroides TaxID=1063 RepID=UPI001F3B597E|nr:TerD family protein [Cereibacter sphaeroides]MCE6957752.1 TerD family protein [Cereibacter sphaeroides]MCE6971622.1 TerD family protein [Cereibacter sphaeroides]
MAVSLKKGGNVSLSKEAPGLASITVGLGWDPRVTDGKAFDLDASVFVCGADGKVLDDKHFIFYGNKVGLAGAIEHSGDNTTGVGDDEDDEKVKIDLPKVPETVTKMVFAVTIHEADERGQNFGQVPKAHIRVVNNADNAELARYDLVEDYSTETAMILGELYRNNGEWKLKAIGAGFAGGLAPLATAHGVDVG